MIERKMQTMSHSPDPYLLPPAPRPPEPSRRFSWLVILLALLVGFSVYRQLTDFWRGPAAEPRAITPRGDLAEAEKTTIEIFQQAAPSVVYITSVALRRDRLGFDVFEIPQGTGSGFIWDTGGHVVTNFHVVQAALEKRDALRVTLNDHSTYDAEIVGASPDKDVAVLRIRAPAARLKPLPLGTSADLQVGQQVYAIGNPFGLDYTLTTGIVSALGRSIQSVTRRRIEDVIQTDAAINPGNSGGPLLDSAGRLIGVNTAIYSPSGSSAGIGFAVPVDTVSRVVPQVITHGRVIRPALGVYPAHDNIARQMNIRGVLIREVEEGSGAEKAGLRGIRQAPDGSILLGDVIQQVDGQPIRDIDSLLNLLEKRNVGDVVEVIVLRDDEPLTVKVQLQ